MQVTEQNFKCEDAEITKHLMGDFPGGPVVDSLLPMQRAWVLSLIRELRSHMAHGMAKKRKKKKARKHLTFFVWLKGWVVGR